MHGKQALHAYIFTHTVILRDFLIHSIDKIASFTDKKEN